MMEMAPGLAWGAVPELIPKSGLMGSAHFMGSENKNHSTPLPMPRKSGIAVWLGTIITGVGYRVVGATCLAGVVWHLTDGLTSDALMTLGLIAPVSFILAALIVCYRNLLSPPPPEKMLQFGDPLENHPVALEVSQGLGMKLPHIQVHHANRDIPPGGVWTSGLRSIVFIENLRFRRDLHTGTINNYGYDPLHLKMIIARSLIRIKYGEGLALNFITAMRFSVTVITILLLFYLLPWYMIFLMLFALNLMYLPLNYQSFSDDSIRQRVDRRAIMYGANLYLREMVLLHGKIPPLEPFCDELGVKALDASNRQSYRENTVRDLVELYDAWIKIALHRQVIYDLDYFVERESLVRSEIEACRLFNQNPTELTEDRYRDVVRRHFDQNTWADEKRTQLKNRLQTIIIDTGYPSGAHLAATKLHEIRKKFYKSMIKAERTLLQRKQNLQIRSRVRLPNMNEWIESPNSTLRDIIYPPVRERFACTLYHSNKTPADRSPVGSDLYSIFVSRKLSKPPAAGVVTSGLSDQRRHRLTDRVGEMTTEDVAKYLPSYRVADVRYDKKLNVVYSEIVNRSEYRLTTKEFFEGFDNGDIFHTDAYQSTIIHNDPAIILPQPEPEKKVGGITAWIKPLFSRFAKN
jgi:hypothetical protein